MVLLLASLISWAIIYAKGRQISRATRQATSFENEFWSGADANQMYQHIRERDGENLSGMEHVFERGFAEYARLVKQTDDSDTVVEGSYRALFGTVWGIMNSFIALADVEQATLAMVAPGIAEALIATAIGLFAAIPAVIAYNRLSNKSERLLNRYDNFMDEFTSVLQRQVLRRNAPHR